MDINCEVSAVRLALQFQNATQKRKEVDPSGPLPLRRHLLRAVKHAN